MKGKVIIYLLALLLLVACHKDTRCDIRSCRDADITIKVNIPTETLPRLMTKSGQNPDEISVNNMKVLVFHNSVFSYKVSAESLTNVSGGVNFNVKLSSTTEPIDLYLIANSGSIVDAADVQPGDSFAQIRAKLEKTITNSGITANFPMWGSKSLPGGIDATSTNIIDNITMLRAVARIDVIATDVTESFTMTSIQAFRVANSMRLIPDTYPVTVPSVPQTVAYQVATDQINVLSNASIAQLYLPEAIAPDDISEATCVVIGGYYGESTISTYYRIDIDPSIAGNPLGQILRNTRYEFDIKYVTKEGYSTANDAANNPSEFIGVNMVLWSNEIKYSVYDDNNYFGIEEIKVIMSGSEASSVELLVETDYPNYLMDWVDSGGTPAGTPQETIQSEIFKVEKSADGTALVISTLGPNANTDSSMTSFFYILVNNMKILMTITQLPGSSITPEPPGPGGLIWAPGNVDAPGTFAPAGELGQMYQWGRNIGWPATGSVTGWDQTTESGFDWSQSLDPCPSGWRVPTNKEINALLTSQGHRWVFAGGAYPNSGVWVAELQVDADNATLDNPGSAVFFPAGGHRFSSGSLADADSNCYYWASDMLWDNSSYFLGANGTYAVYNATSKAEGALVRCVKNSSPGGVG